MKPNTKKTAVWLPVTVALSVALGIWIGNAFSNPSNRQSAGIRKLSGILDLVNSLYVDKVDTDSLIEMSLSDFMAKLDPHSVYIPASDLQAVNEELDGSFSGIGVVFTILHDTIVVNEVVSGGPSERVGLMPGDRIVTIDDSIASGPGWDQARILRTLRGEKGTEVRLGIRRSTSGDKLLPYTIERGDIPVTSIDASYMIEPEVGYVRVNKFGRTTYDEFFTSLVQLSAQGAKKFIVDLRSNTGGFMEIANLMANEFLPRGARIVSMRGRNDGDESVIYADGHGTFLDSELVVLIDEYSASSSEIFAGAIQDNDRGLVIGRRSFGKGLVQRQIDLPDSSALRLTTARYYTPSGRCIQKRYTLGGDSEYELDLLNRMSHGETMSVDSIKVDRSQVYSTMGGRTVYGGGGILPDIFVPTDTSGLSKYYFNVANAGLLQKYAFDYVDANRSVLENTKDVSELLSTLPADSDLLYSFVQYAHSEAKIPVQWYYINISRNLIVNLLKALIARDIYGVNGYFSVVNPEDPTVIKALDEIAAGTAAFPVTTYLDLDRKDTGEADY
ncbi:MAG: S41 family peptidase [Bacteroides sp.]|nr:S41 family peptidase [Bacteroides sp.]